jgi:hypothetical protein
MKHNNLTAHWRRESTILFSTHQLRTEMNAQLQNFALISEEKARHMPEQGVQIL